jgi:hypothetical protein
MHTPYSAVSPKEPGGSIPTPSNTRGIRYVIPGTEDRPYREDLSEWERRAGVHQGEDGLLRLQDRSHPRAGCSRGRGAAGPGIVMKLFIPDTRHGEL